MHTHSIESMRHEHVFLGSGHDRNERRTWAVIALTAAMMGGEIVAGSVFGSMALTADGWHMATHAGALTIAALAYLYARRHAHDPRFSFGAGKFGDLAGFASAVVLVIIAVLIGYESLIRLASPVLIQFDQAIWVAALGLAVNLVSAWMLHADDHHAGHDHSHHHHHDHAHDHEHDHQAHAEHRHAATRDNNLRSAYFHVLADALTSVLAIVGLLAGRFYGWVWMDPLMGIVGAIVIAHWSWGLMRDAGGVLLDATPDPRIAEAVRKRIEVEGDRIVDLHLWRVGPGHSAVVLAIVSHNPREPDHYRALLTGLPGLSHITVEVRRCPDETPRAA